MHGHQGVATRERLPHQRQLRQPHRGVNGRIRPRSSSAQLDHRHAHLANVVRRQCARLRGEHRAHKRRLGQHLTRPFCHVGIATHLRHTLGKQLQGSTVVQNLLQLLPGILGLAVQPCLQQELGAKGHHHLIQAWVPWTVVAQVRHRFVHLDRIARRPSKRDGHVRQERRRLHASSITHGHHAFCQRPRRCRVLHDGAISAFDVEYEVLQPRSQFLGHDGCRDQPQILHSRCDVSGGVHPPVRRSQIVGLSDNGVPTFANDLLKLRHVDACLVARNRFQLVDGSTCVGQTSACDHGHIRTACRQHGGEHQGHCVPHASRAVLVQNRSTKGL